MAEPRSFLEYVPGGSVGSCLRKYGKFDEEITKSFTEQILDGLEYLHSVGILHRVCSFCCWQHLFFVDTRCYRT